MLSLSQIAWLILCWKLKEKGNKMFFMEISTRKGIDRSLTSLRDCCQRRGCVDSGLGDHRRKQQRKKGGRGAPTILLPGVPLERGLVVAKVEAGVAI